MQQKFFSFLLLTSACALCAFPSTHSPWVQLQWGSCASWLAVSFLTFPSARAPPTARLARSLHFHKCFLLAWFTQSRFSCSVTCLLSVADSLLLPVKYICKRRSSERGWSIFKSARISASVNNIYACLRRPVSSVFLKAPQIRVTLTFKEYLAAIKGGIY